MLVTVFKNIHATSTPYHLEVQDVLLRIKTGTSKALIQKIRAASTKGERDTLKKKLPSICFCGTFRERRSAKLIKHSGLICLDFDELKTQKALQELKNTLCTDPYTYTCFISPSGRGLKVLVRIPPEAHNHKRYFQALQDYYNTTHFDTSGSDLSRVCYESYDPEIYTREDAAVFDKKLETKTYLSYDVSEVTIPIKQESAIIKRLEQWWHKNFGFVEGARNENIFKLACAFSEFGIAQYSCEQHLSRYTQEDFTPTEIKRTIQSAYQKTKAKFASKYFEDTQVAEYIHRRLHSGIGELALKQELEDKGYTDMEIEATFEVAKQTQPIEVFWKHSKSGKITIVSQKFKEYLKQKGFYKYYPEGSEHFVFVKIASNLIENTTPDKIKTFVLSELLENEHTQVFEYLALNTKYFKDDYLNLLDPVKVAIKSDTKTTSYCYFRNCAVAITPERLTLIDYIALDGYVWKEQVIDRDFQITQDYDNDFKTFLYHVSGGDTKNHRAFETTLGYLIHSYKNKGYCPAIILNDELISENPEGGTGKGLLVYALAQLKKCVVIDGKTFDKNKPFAYQTLASSTQLLVFDDVKKNFDFEGLFSLITEGITLEKKNKDAIKLDFYTSPKIVITTNYAIAGKGSSHDRRRWELELSQHYSAKRTPLDDFGKLLFDDWSDSEWLRFDNYMLHCLQKYLKNGFTKAAFKNLETRKFISQSCFEFYQWLEESEDNYLIRKDRVAKSELFEDFISTYTDYRRWLTKKRFNSWLKAWATYKGISCQEGNTNGVRWISFGIASLTSKREEIIF